MHEETPVDVIFFGGKKLEEYLEASGCFEIYIYLGHSRNKRLLKIHEHFAAHCYVKPFRRYACLGQEWDLKGSGAHKNAWY